MLLGESVETAQVIRMGMGKDPRGNHRLSLQHILRAKLFVNDLCMDLPVQSAVNHEEFAILKTHEKSALGMDQRHLRCGDSFIRRGFWGKRGILYAVHSDGDIGHTSRTFSLYIIIHHMGKSYNGVPVKIRGELVRFYAFLRIHLVSFCLQFPAVIRVILPLCVMDQHIVGFMFFKGIPQFLRSASLVFGRIAVTGWSDYSQGEYRNFYIIFVRSTQIGNHFDQFSRTDIDIAGYGDIPLAVALQACVQII